MKIIFDEIMNQEYEKSNVFLALNFGNFKLEFLRKKDKQKQLCFSWSLYSKSCITFVENTHL